MKTLIRPLGGHVPPCLWYLPVVLTCALAQVAWGYGSAGRWPATTLDNSTGSFGDAASLTWSIVPDGTTITTLEGTTADSNLVQFLDDTWGAGPGGTDYTRRPWFGLVESTFARWSSVGGVEMVYQPADDGAPVDRQPAVLGKRGDIRLSGAAIDGALGTLAHNKLPSRGGDMVIDTLDGDYFGNAGYGHRRFRNILMHELGHGLGLTHVTSKNASFLMEPWADVTIDGPQSDDILGLHHLYGDRFERTANGRGNDTLADATPLGYLGHGESVSLGTDGYGGTRVEPDQTDFVSISNSRDSDYYSFRINQPSRIDLLVQPLGTTYQNNGNGEWNTQAVADLRLSLHDAAGNQVLAVDDHPAGTAELQQGLKLTNPGEYVVRVAGQSHLAQFYALHVAADPLAPHPGDYNGDGVVDAADMTVWRDSMWHPAGQGPNGGLPGGQSNMDGYLLWKDNYNAGVQSPVPGDFNNDGRTDLADYTVWRDSRGAMGFNLAADADGNYFVDQADYALWRSAAGGLPASALDAPAASNVSEPSSASLAAVLGLAMMGLGRLQVVRRGRKCPPATPRNEYNRT